MFKFALLFLVLLANIGWSANPHACCPHDNSVQGIPKPCCPVADNSHSCSDNGQPVSGEPDATRKVRVKVNEPVPKGGFNISETTPASYAAPQFQSHSLDIFIEIDDFILKPEIIFLSPPEQPPRLAIDL